jgi:hypothetical protein
MRDDAQPAGHMETQAAVLTRRGGKPTTPRRCWRCRKAVPVGCKVKMQRSGSTPVDSTECKVPTPSLFQLVMPSLAPSAGASSVAVAVAGVARVVGEVVRELPTSH